MAGSGIRKGELYVMGGRARRPVRLWYDEVGQWTSMETSLRREGPTVGPRHGSIYGLRMWIAPDQDKAVCS